MIILKCEYCGFEQVIKKRLNKLLFYELTHYVHLYCPRNECKKVHPRSEHIPEGLVRHGMVFNGWETIVTEKDAEYLQTQSADGIWYKIINPTEEELEAIARAKEIKEIGVRMLQEQQVVPPCCENT